MSAPANPFRCPPGPLRARQPDRALPQDEEAEVEADRARRQGHLLQAAPVPERLEGALSRHHRMGARSRRAARSTRSIRRRRRWSPISASTRPRSPTSIPPQRRRASRSAAGVADHTGWCPIDPVTFESTAGAQHPRVGDAAIIGAMPKSAFSANSQAKALAPAIVDSAGGPRARRATAHQHLLQPGRARLRHHGRGRLSRRQGQLADIPGAGGVSPVDADDGLRSARGAVRRGLVQDHHRRSLRLTIMRGVALVACLTSLIALPLRATPSSNPI